MAPAKLLGVFFLLFVCLTYVQSGKSKKTIKIHVPYYVKHIHHYKKVYVPKVQVVKHEHLHKKEHEHHHHHDHGHHHHDHYDKSSDGGYDDEYYDDFDHRSYDASTNKLPINRPKLPYRTGNQRENWRDRSSSEELTSSEEDDYITGPDDEGTLPAPLQGNQRFRPRPTPLTNKKYRRTLIKRIDNVPTIASAVYISPSENPVPKRVVSRVAT